MIDIKIYGDKILKQKCASVSSRELSDLQDFIEMMTKRVTNDEGAAGLAAPQLGLKKRIAVIGLEDKVYVLINPKITKKSRQKEKGQEGCLSLPGVYVNVKRPKEVEIEFLNRKGETQKIKAKDFLARVMQHEIDHLNGRLIVDGLNFFKRRKIKQEMKRYL